MVAVPSGRVRRSPATDLYQVLDTSDVPGGVINIVTGLRDELAPVLAAHDDVDGLWYFGHARRGRPRSSGSSAGNMKRTWVDYGLGRDWADLRARRGRGVPGAGDPGEEHLGAVRGVSRAVE